MNNINTEKYKAILEKEKQSLQLQLNAISLDKTREAGPLSQDWEEQALEVENDQVIDRLELLELSKLKDIEAALKRIEDGSYGTCISCNQSISETRIKAIPFTNKCIKCG